MNDQMITSLEDLEKAKSFIDYLESVGLHKSATALHKELLSQYGDIVQEVPVRGLLSYDCSKETVRRLRKEKKKLQKQAAEAEALKLAEEAKEVELSEIELEQEALEAEQSETEELSCLEKENQEESEQLKRAKKKGKKKVAAKEAKRKAEEDANAEEEERQKKQQQQHAEDLALRELVRDNKAERAEEERLMEIAKAEMDRQKEAEEKEKADKLRREQERADRKKKKLAAKSAKSKPKKKPTKDNQQEVKVDYSSASSEDLELAVRKGQQLAQSQGRRLMLEKAAQSGVDGESKKTAKKKAKKVSKKAEETKLLEVDVSKTPEKRRSTSQSTASLSEEEDDHEKKRSKKSSKSAKKKVKKKKAEKVEKRKKRTGQSEVNEDRDESTVQSVVPVLAPPNKDTARYDATGVLTVGGSIFDNTGAKSTQADYDSAEEEDKVPELPGHTPAIKNGREEFNDKLEQQANQVSELEKMMQASLSEVFTTSMMPSDIESVHSLQY